MLFPTLLYIVVFVLTNVEIFLQHELPAFWFHTSGVLVFECLFFAISSSAGSYSGMKLDVCCPLGVACVI